MSRALEVIWDEFEAAFIIGHPEARYFFNVMTGEVLYLSHMDEERTRERVQAKVSSADWVPIPRASTTEGMSEIQTFIDTESDQSFQEELKSALSDPIPFRAFMMALVGKPEAKERWSGIREDGISKRMHAFCETHDITINDARF